MLSLPVFEAAMWIKSMYYKIMIENQKEKKMEIKEILHKSLSTGL